MSGGGTNGTRIKSAAGLFGDEAIRVIAPAIKAARAEGIAAPYCDGLRFIFMLTRNDRTAADVSQHLRTALGLGVRHIGFKDIGLPIDSS